ncbi:response regulator [Vulcaniibacterium tengchongense]|uniref:Two-component system chemotaxis response regulator CheY n=1 Tax=Vulcaniibacterium tengchongense TaxID=1273429 RepID=A0A3N4VDX7_9GAMM|nr:response regulator [Vulcaniibacterium tengchongense]RPE80838.1 two-component system chemotaxis response regulator CheY [Vulcaniibacterium tengchongense]
MSKNLLIVDDSTSMRQMVAFALTSGGYSVREAEDGQAALDIAKGGARFDAVITDVNMPRMDGIELIRQLRQLPEYRFTPLLMLTTESGADKKQEGKAAGATGWLVKPFDPEQLLATVRKVLS